MDWTDPRVAIPGKAIWSLIVSVMKNVLPPWLGGFGGSIFGIIRRVLVQNRPPGGCRPKSEHKSVSLFLTVNLVAIAGEQG
jgi:hypothetical protein